jgi:hypothetical protein
MVTRAIFELSITEIILKLLEIKFITFWYFSPTHVPFQIPPPAICLAGKGRFLSWVLLHGNVKSKVSIYYFY